MKPVQLLQPQTNVIALLERLLGEARSGELRSIVCYWRRTMTNELKQKIIDLAHQKFSESESDHYTVQIVDQFGIVTDKLIVTREHWIEAWKASGKLRRSDEYEDEAPTAER